MNKALCGWSGALGCGLGYALRTVVGLCALAVIGGGCTPMGSKQIPTDRFDYNTAIATSSNEQMLLNLVRLHHSEVPTFLAVSSVITQYVWATEAGVAGSGGEYLSFPAWSVGGSANARYFERPTVTYAPLSGQEFASQLIQPVRADVVFSLVSSGWPPDQLLGMTLQRINDVENHGFAATQGDRRTQSKGFSRAIEIIIELAKRDAIELVRSGKQEKGEKEDLYLDFSEKADDQTHALISELKSTIGLESGRSRYRVTRKIVGRAPDEVTIRMHSLLELMGALSAGVEAGAKEKVSAGASQLPTLPMAFKVRCGNSRPNDSFVAVQYRGQWYDVALADEESKRAFGLLIYLFQMQASQNAGAGPLITVPVG